MSSQVLIIVVIAFGALLNVLAKPWSSTDSMLERRRNDLVALVLWLVLFIIAGETVRAGILSAGGPDAFDLQDWTALVLPFAIAAPYLLELTATLIRQLEMWQWMRRATIQALPIAWMYRTMTVGEPDPDGAWLCSRQWASWEHHSRDRNVFNQACSFWQCTSRDATLFLIFRGWMAVLLSALRYSAAKARKFCGARTRVRCAEYCAMCMLVVLLVAVMGTLLALSSVEIFLLAAVDYLWWRQCALGGYIVARYDTVHFGRAELQRIFEHSIELRETLADVDGVDAAAVHTRIMGAVMTTAAALENAFRRAYLSTPVYELSLSNRAALREKYKFVGCDLDRLIKQVRVLLEQRHTAGLMSITSTAGTIEAALHNNIESILSVALFFEPLQLYDVVARIAQTEAEIEQRLAKKKVAEHVTRERVVYIDARNAAFWLLWAVVVRDWTSPESLWGIVSRKKRKGDRVHRAAGNQAGEPREAVESLDLEDPERLPEPAVAPYGKRWIDALYVVAVFLSRCRYCKRYSIGRQSEAGFYDEARALCRTVEQRRDVLELFHSLSEALREARGIDLLGWVEREYGLRWLPGPGGKPKGDGRLTCAWTDDTGNEHEEEVSIVFEVAAEENGRL